LTTTAAPPIEEGWAIVHEGIVVDEGDDYLREPPESAASFSNRATPELERALFLSGIMEPTTTTTPGDALSTTGSFSAITTTTMANQNIASHSERARKSLANSIAFSSLEACYLEDFDTLLRESRVRISQANSYQGKCEGSINGCTVIAPLLCIHHFLHDTSLPDELFEQVMDVETPVLLQQVRKSLGLTKDALIIPSDVHDFLMEKQLLDPSQFVTVCGGNLLDHAHVDAFLEQLVEAAYSSGKNNKTMIRRRVAATLFFHEHVVAILPQGSSTSDTMWFDVLDSLPFAKTLRRSEQQHDDSFVPNAARFRCLDMEALKSTLLWYACSKMHEENRSYIDMYDWDEAYSDFDPRVFQAFVWGEQKD